MRIGELAKATHCSVETIRYYEREGLLPAPARSDSNYRSYTAKHVERLRFVRNCRALDMTQSEIRALLVMLEQSGNDCTSIDKLIEDHIEHVDVRIRQLQSLRGQLTELRRQCSTAESVSACGILHGLTSMASQSKPRRSSLAVPAGS